MIHTWSIMIADYIGRELAIDDRKKAIVSYGVEVLIGAIVKLLVFIAVPLLLGVLREFLVVYFSFAFLRLSAGGIHCSAYYRCLMFTVASYLLIAYTAMYLSIYSLPYQEIYWGILAFSFLIILVKAPVDVDEKPVISPVRRKALKIISCLVVVIYFLLSVHLKPDSVIYFASGMAVLFQTFTLTQNGVKFFKWIDSKI